MGVVGVVPPVGGGSWFPSLLGDGAAPGAAIRERWLTGFWFTAGRAYSRRRLSALPQFGRQCLSYTIPAKDSRSAAHAVVPVDGLTCTPAGSAPAQYAALQLLLSDPPLDHRSRKSREEGGPRRVNDPGNGGSQVPGLRDHMTLYYSLSIRSSVTVGGWVCRPVFACLSIASQPLGGKAGPTDETEPSAVPLEDWNRSRRDREWRITYRSGVGSYSRVSPWLSLAPSPGAAKRPRRRPELSRSPRRSPLLAARVLRSMNNHTAPLAPIMGAQDTLRLSASSLSNDNIRRSKCVLKTPR